MNQRTHLIETLEARIAPAIVLTGGGTTASWTDVDGDAVTLKASKAIFTAANAATVFTFLAQQPGDFGEQLALLDLSVLGAAANGVSLTFTAKRQDALLGGVQDGFKDGDGSVNVGAIDATGLDLGAVKLAGDLGAIFAGDATLTTPAVKSIVVTSAGAFGDGTQGGGGATLNWFFRGRLGTVTVKGDFFATLDVLDTNDAVTAFNAAASAGAITIWGDLVGGDDSLSGLVGTGTGYIFAEGNLGPVKILGEIYGGSADFGGSVSSMGTIASITVGGSLFGGSAANTGEISGLLGTVKIDGSIVGGTAEDSGVVTSFGALSSVTVGGSIFGGPASNTGAVFASGALGKVSVGGSVIGGDSPRDANGELLLDGGTPIIISNSGAIGSETGLGTVSIKLDLIAGEGDLSGAIYTAEPFGGNIKSVTIGGSLQGFSLIDDGTGNLLRVATGIYADGQLGTVKVGAIVGDDPLNPATIIALGQADPASAKEALAIASLTVLRGVSNAHILAGFDSFGEALNPDVQIGAIRIGNSLLGSSISAGVPSSGDGFGDVSNALALAGAGFSDNAALLSRIASLTVGGYVLGNPLGDGDFVNGAVAQDIGTVKIGAVALELTPGNVLDLNVLGVNREFIVREVA